MAETPGASAGEPLRRRVSAARARLEEAGIERGEAGLDAELLLREVMGWDRARFVAHEDESLPPALESAFEAMLSRRERREPVSLIIGRREFWGLDFEVTRDVLTPRPESELIVEEAICCLGAGVQSPPLTIVDVGTGSGCLAVALARELPSATVIATDVSERALDVAARNAARHGVSARVLFERSSMFGSARAAGLVVSNPPYVPAADLASLPPEVRLFEPREALDGGPDGLALVRQLLVEAPRVLLPGGWLIFEFGAGQGNAVKAEVQASELQLVRIRPDLQGLPRTAVVRAAKTSARVECGFHGTANGG